jgi:hypothetical protein
MKLFSLVAIAIGGKNPKIIVSLDKRFSKPKISEIDSTVTKMRTVGHLDASGRHSVKAGRE